MTVRVNGAAAVCEPTDSCSPAGADSNVSATVRGSSRRVTVCVSPAPSVAVSSSSRCDGYSWSGAENEPEAAPPQVWSGCVWQLPGSPSQQCWSSSFQLSAEAGSAAPCQSVAPPEKVSVSPTAQVVVPDGASIRAVGGAPAVTVTVAVPSSPPASVTRSRTVTVPAVGYVRVGVRGGRVVVGAVAVQVPRVGQRVAVRVARRRAVELDRERRGARSAAWRSPRAVGASFGLP